MAPTKRAALVGFIREEDDTVTIFESDVEGDFEKFYKESLKKSKLAKKEISELDQEINTKLRTDKQKEPLDTETSPEKETSPDQLAEKFPEQERQDGDFSNSAEVKARNSALNILKKLYEVLKEELETKE